MRRAGTQILSSLFHYQQLVEAHLTALLTTRTVKFSRPDTFNDPWDCRVHYRVPTDVPGRERLLHWLIEQHRKRFPDISKSQRTKTANDFMAIPEKLEASFVRMEEEMYRALCKQYRVYCLSEKPDSPLMWAHYTGSHTGICLEFDAKVAPFTQHDGATKVIYSATYPAHDMVTVGYEPLITKSDDWAYEAEWRSVAEERVCAQAPETIKTDNDFLTLPPGVLKSVIVGCLASEKSRQLVARLVRDHALEILIRQATVARDSYDLVIVPPFN